MDMYGSVQAEKTTGEHLGEFIKNIIPLDVYDCINGTVYECGVSLNSAFSTRRHKNTRECRYTEMLPCLAQRNRVG